MRVYVSTDIGKMRALNEDAYYKPRAGEPFCAVADGMGGHNAGEVASAMAVREFAERMRKAKAPWDDALRSAVEQANASIFSASLEKDELSGMGTTMTALCFSGEEVFVAHVGDSRAYLIRNGSIVRITTDHTLVEEMVENGLITLEEARVHPKRNYITRALGTGNDVNVDVIRVDRRESDVYLLCTDGLSNHVSEWEMRDIVMNSPSGEDCVSKLVALALEHGGSDNITAMLVTCEEDSE